jgi:hypothetical protein
MAIGMAVENKQAKAATIDKALNRKAEVPIFSPEDHENIMQEMMHFYLRKSPALGSFIAPEIKA